MSIKKNPRRLANPWELRWREDKCQRSRSFVTKKAAEDFWAQVRVDKRRGRYINADSANTRFSSYARQWLENSLRPNGPTFIRHRGILEKHIFGVIGDKTIAQIQRGDIQGMVTLWANNGLKRRTIDRHLAVLTAIFNLAAADNIIFKSPVTKIKRPQAEKPHRHAMTVEEIDSLMAAIDERYVPHIYIALSTGVRWGELANFKIRHLNWKDRILTIEGAKTAAGNRTIELSVTDINYINLHLVATGRTMAQQEEPLFTSPKGLRLKYSNHRNRVFKPACRKAGLDDLCFHDLRRTAATLMIAAGMAHKDVQERLGHTDIRTTLNMYAESTPEGRRKIANAMEQVLSARPGRRSQSYQKA